MWALRYIVPILLILSNAGYAAGSSEYLDNLDIRPAIGYGYASSNDGKRGMGYNAGVRIVSTVQSISTAAPNKRWGIELSSVSPFESRESFKHEKYMAIGFVLEQVLPAQIVATIGTIGYIGVDQNKNKPFGLVTGFAWEPRITGNTLFSVGLRYETIYDSSTISRYSLNVGLKLTVF
jgi:hypothetical protein